MFIDNTAKVQVKDSQAKVIASQVYDKVIFEGTGKDEKGKVVSTVPTEELLAQAIAFYTDNLPKDKDGKVVGDPVVNMLADMTYAYDLGRRASIRQGLVTAVAGPDKAIEKAIKDLMAARAAAGKPLSLEAATAKVQAMMAD